MTLNQLQLFIIFFINGIIIGIIFDTFRIIRKTFKHKDFIIYVQDILFWILTGFILMYSTFIFNDGEFRFFLLIGVCIGFVTYLFTLSKIFIKTNVSILKFIKKFISKILKILLIPIKKLLLRPCTFLVINIKKFFKNIKCLKIKKLKEISKEKKDFI